MSLGRACGSILVPPRARQPDWPVARWHLCLVIRGGATRWCAVEFFIGTDDACHGGAVYALPLRARSEHRPEGFRMEKPFALSRKATQRMFGGV